MDNVRIADSEWDSDISTHVWMLGEIRIVLEYDFPKQCKRVTFATVVELKKVIQSIADTVLYDFPGKGVIRWRDLTFDSEGKTSFFQSPLLEGK